MKLTKRHLNEIREVLNELYPSVISLQSVKGNEPIGVLVSLATRVKIYHGCMKLIHDYQKRGCVNQDDLKLVLKRIKLHRFQIKKLNNSSPYYVFNHKYLVGLVALLHISFGN